MNYTVVTYNDLVNNDYSFLANTYSYLQEYEAIKNLQSKYENIFSYFNSMDGFAFPSKNYMPECIPTSKKIPLIQIGNVNSELCLSQNQKFEFLSIKEAQEKKRFLLSEKGILISLTGGDDVDNNISAFFDNDFKCFLNQRVSFFKLKTDENIDLLYYFYAFTKHKIFNIQWIGTGSIQKNTVAKERKKIFIPKITNTETIKYISLLMQAIINKEKLIKAKHKSIIDGIEKELLENQNDNVCHFEMPRIKELEEIGRLDTRVYSKQFKEIQHKIKNYKGGYFHIDSHKIKSGSTPDTRHISSDRSLKYMWVTPTTCSDYGLLTEERINFKGTNNINQDCILLINRTSKGGMGEYVGIAGFYNFTDFGKGQHNQGMYQVFDYEKDKLLFMLCFLNALLMRKYCAALSVGSKMKELKMEHFSQIPFPNFPEEKQKEIAKLYHNSEISYETKECTLDNFLEIDNEYNKNAGIYELDKTAKQLKAKLNLAIDNIVNDRKVDIGF